MEKIFMTFTMAFVGIITILLIGCTEDPRVDNLQQEIISTNNEIASLKKEIEDLKNQQNFDQFVRSLNKIAYLKPGNEGYSTIQSDLGVLTIHIDNIVAYANGSKVTLAFGNPLSASIDGLKAKIQYGEVDKEGIPNYGTAKTKEVTFNETLQPGSWTDIKVVLEGISCSKLGFIEVRGLTHTRISLTKK